MKIFNLCVVVTFVIFSCIFYDNLLCSGSDHHPLTQELKIAIENAAETMSIITASSLDKRKYWKQATVAYLLEQVQENGLQGNLSRDFQMPFAIITDPSGQTVKCNNENIILYYFRAFQNGERLNEDIQKVWASYDAAYQKRESSIVQESLKEKP